MAEYQIDWSGDVEGITWQSLDTFTQAYIEAAFWTSNAPGVTTEAWQAIEEHDEGSIPDDVGFSDLAPEFLNRIIAECESFQAANAALIERACETVDGYDDNSAGHDFWLTRNRHGAGFWDRGLGDIGDKLTAASNACGEADLYLGDDGKIYLA